MSQKNNIRGAFERARQRWHFAAIYVCGRMGRGATTVLQTSGLLVEHTSRALFYRDGVLVAFPGLDLLALWLGVNEKTVREVIKKLVDAGLVRIRHRYKDSNLYYLMIPPDAEAHLFACEAAIIRRRRGWKNWAPKTPAGRTSG
jgi:hypothetical protein